MKNRKSIFILCVVLAVLLLSSGGLFAYKYFTKDDKVSVKEENKDDVDGSESDEEV